MTEIQDFMSIDNCEKEFKDFCKNGRLMTGEQINLWSFSRMNTQHKELSFCANYIRENYINVKNSLNEKTLYNVNFWMDNYGSLGCCFHGRIKQYVNIKRVKDN